MKKYIAALACALALLVPCSGCATLASVGGAEESSAAETAQPTEAPTAAPTPTAEPTPTVEPTPTAEPTPDPAAALQGCTWVTYAETSGVEHFIFKLNFNEDGTISYMAGWYMSEVAYQGTGTYTADGERITYTLSSDSFEPAQMSGSIAYTLSDGQLTLSASEGDALTYLLESGSLTFAVEGSAQDVPPTL
ncbi:MAG TPA: hypothetical protein IAA38_02590 [Candidatus Ruminococcus gallistercoris]|nr:hypothetical protein [Candidatus Ruminococcus gallistercoris]